MNNKMKKLYFNVNPDYSSWWSNEWKQELQFKEQSWSDEYNQTLTKLLNYAIDHKESNFISADGKFKVTKDETQHPMIFITDLERCNMNVIDGTKHECDAVLAFNLMQKEIWEKNVKEYYEAYMEEWLEEKAEGYRPKEVKPTFAEFCRDGRQSGEELYEVSSEMSYDEIVNSYLFQFEIQKDIQKREASLFPEWDIEFESLIEDVESEKITDEELENIVNKFPKDKNDYWLEWNEAQEQQENIELYNSLLNEGVNDGHHLGIYISDGVFLTPEGNFKTEN